MTDDEKKLDLAYQKCRNKWGYFNHNQESLKKLEDELKNFKENVDKYFLNAIYYWHCQFVHKYKTYKSEEERADYIEGLSADRWLQFQYLLGGEEADIPKAFYNVRLLLDEDDALNDDGEIQDYNLDYNFKELINGKVYEGFINKFRDYKAGLDVSDEMVMLYSSKNENKEKQKAKTLEIPNGRYSANTGFDFYKSKKNQHEWLSILEYKIRDQWQGVIKNEKHATYTANYKTTTPYDNSNENYIVGNLGFVYSNKPHVKGDNELRRFFYSIPIAIKSEKVFHHDNSKNGNKHSEDALFKFLANNFPELMASWFEEADVGAGHKIYAIVIDVHSTYDMCKKCYGLVDDYLAKIRAALYKVSSKDNEGNIPPFKLKKKNDIAVVVRYTSSEEGQNSKRAAYISENNNNNNVQKLDLHAYKNFVLHGREHIKTKNSHSTPLSRHVFHSNDAMNRPFADKFKVEDGQCLKDVIITDFAKIFNKK